MDRENHPVAIIGAGPAGCTMACLLAQRGIRTVVFDDDKRPELLVGESLVPAVIPVLRKLGVEKRVAEISVLKPGASFFHSGGTRVHLKFQNRGKKQPGYAYNVPRPQFDRILKARAEELGVRFVNRRASVQKSLSPDRELELAPESLAAAKINHPQWLLDATGRGRLFARTLQLDATKGKRVDVSYFAHFENFLHDEVEEGQIIISILEHGWSWRIPLKDKLSVGVVIHKDAVKHYGDTPEERLEKIIYTDPLLKTQARNAKRVSDVMVYSNYQLISDRGYGRGWAMLGDAYGFVDPMLSPGLFMSLESANLLDNHFFKHGAPSSDKTNGLDHYCRELLKWHKSWQDLIDCFYDGRILRMYEAGNLIAKDKPKWSPEKIMERHIQRAVQAMASGAATRSPYNRRLIEFTARRLIWGVPETDYYAVKQ
ncbi:MAG: NAD(P)/FAD-dependent oxidoreductase [Akkermansiaceae bacterium]